MKKRSIGFLSVLGICGIAVLGLAVSGFCPGTPEGRSCGQVRSCVKTGGCRETACKGTSAKVQAGQWGTDYQAALDASKKNGLPVFAFFTGSDWCGWCMRLDREVLNLDKFRQWSGKHVNLLKIDFPQGGNQTAAERKANEALMRKYGVRGFPTIVLLDKDGKEIKRTGYRRGGVDSYIEHLEKLLK